MANTYFQLPQSQGGKRFGPYQGMVQIGTHPSSCQLPLQAPGLYPVHVQVIETPQGQYQVNPVDRAALIWVVPNGRTQATPVQQAVLINAGDTLILGSPQGPALRVAREEHVARSSGPGMAAGAAGGGLAMGVAQEIQRQAMARMMARNPLFREINNAMFRYRTGSLANPRTLVALGGTLVTVLGTGVAGCGGLLLAAAQFFAGR